jgi:hypothetical protein
MVVSVSVDVGIYIHSSAELSSYIAQGAASSALDRMATDLLRGKGLRGQQQTV